jgi:hypothetical protein
MCWYRHSGVGIASPVLVSPVRCWYRQSDCSIFFIVPTRCDAAKCRFYGLYSFQPKFLCDSACVPARMYFRSYCTAFLWAGIAQSVQTHYGLDGLGPNPGGGEIFRSRPVQPWGSPTLLYRVFPCGKAAGAWRWPPTPSSADLRKEQR